MGFIVNLLSFHVISCLKDVIFVAPYLQSEEASIANVNITIRMDEDLKKNADVLFDELGMSFTTAINVFVKQALREGRLPFEVTTKPSVSYTAIELDRD